MTAVCEKILNLGMELRSRPFVYANTSQLDLDSFLLYTTTIRVEVSWLNYGYVDAVYYSISWSKIMHNRFIKSVCIEILLIVVNYTSISKSTVVGHVAK